MTGYHTINKGDDGSTSFDPRLDSIEAGLEMAMAHHKIGCNEEAMAICRRILNHQPDCIQAASILGLLYIEDGRSLEAIPVLEWVVRSNKNDFSALNNLGLALHRSGRMEDAAMTFRQVLALNPKYLKAYYNLGNVFQDMGNADATIACYRAALELIPNDSRAQHMMGRLYLEHHYLDQARVHFETAVKLDPHFAEAWVSLSSAALMQGDYRTGWPLYRWRFKTDDHHTRIYPFRHSWPMWQGEAFIGRRLLVHCEQGMGDSLQFSRFLPQVKSLGGELVFQVQPPLMSLFETSPCIDKLLPLTDVSHQDVGVDLYVPLLDLPACLGVEEASLRHDKPYVKADNGRIEKWKQTIPSDKFNVGFSWAGNPLHRNDRRRSSELAHFETLFRIPGTRFYSLQKGTETDPTNPIFSRYDVMDCGSQLNDFGDTAGLVHNLDLIISVDTAVIHLAGAMGKPTWVLLPYLPDWRWGLYGTTTPWYPTMRLFRQAKPDCWEPVFQSLAATLMTEMIHARGDGE